MEPIVVFVVDDTRDTREALAGLLRREGYHTVCAANGWEAIKALEDAAPSVVLLDIEMPVMDGLSTLRAIRQDPKWHHLLVLSGNTDEQSVRGEAARGQRLPRQRLYAARGRGAPCPLLRIGGNLIRTGAVPAYSRRGTRSRCWSSPRHWCGGGSSTRRRWRACGGSPGSGD